MLLLEPLEPRALPSWTAAPAVRAALLQIAEQWAQRDPVAFAQFAPTPTALVVMLTQEAPPAPPLPGPAPAPVENLAAIEQWLHDKHS